MGSFSVLRALGTKPESASSLFGGGTWSWPIARQRFLDAQTATTKDDQDKAYADTFRALGQLIYLVQDASVPAHVRNDAHPLLVNPDWYKDCVQANRPNLARMFSVMPPTSIFTPTGNTDAPESVARLLDTDKFSGAKFSVLKDPSIGLSEYTNGNFLSRDTLFKDFALPRQAGLSFLAMPEGYQPYTLSYLNTQTWTWNETFRSYDFGPLQLSTGESKSWLTRLHPSTGAIRDPSMPGPSAVDHRHRTSGGWSQGSVSRQERWLLRKTGGFLS